MPTYLLARSLRYGVVRPPPTPRSRMSMPRRSCRPNTSCSTGISSVCPAQYVTASSPSYSCRFFSWRDSRDAPSSGIIPAVISANMPFPPIRLRFRRSLAGSTGLIGRAVQSARRGPLSARHPPDPLDAHLARRHDPVGLVADEAEAQLGGHAPASRVGRVVVDLHVRRAPDPERDGGQPAGGGGRVAPPDVVDVDPVADLPPTGTDAAHEAARAEDPAGAGGEHPVVELGAVVPRLGPAVEQGTPVDERQGLVGDPRHPRPQVGEAVADRLAQRLGVLAAPPAEDQLPGLDALGRASHRLSLGGRWGTRRRCG